MADRTDNITRDELIRAILAVRRRLPARATGTEALEELAIEIDSPHMCESIYSDGSEGPCLHCAQWVGDRLHVVKP